MNQEVLKAEQDLVGHLNAALDDLRTKSSFTSTLTALLANLAAARVSLGPRMTDVVRRHPLYAALAGDPFIDRTRAKPRGYPGDAPTIDFIYQGLPEETRRATSPVALAWFDAEMLAPSAVAVRQRRDLVAARIDEVAARIEQPRVLSVACGHLCEAASSEALQQGRVGVLTALDQDEDSISLVREANIHRPAVKPVLGSVRDILKGRVDIRDYDLIYTAGLYDYLPDSIAIDLTSALVAGLRPGGELLLGNFIDTFTGAAYMESLMEWPLIWRSEAEVRALCQRVPQSMIASLQTWVDPTGCVVYLSLRRA